GRVLPRAGDGVALALEGRGEPLLLRPEAAAAEVPLAEVAGRVPGVAQPLGERDDLQRQLQGAGRLGELLERPPVAGDVRGQAEARLVLAGEDGRPRRRADGAGSVGVGEADALAGEGVDARRLVEAVAVAGEVGPAEVVG